MESQREKLAEELEKAIKAENDGYYFYLMAARSTQDPQGREIFQQLAEEELEHAAYLKANYRSLRESGHLDRGSRLTRRTDLTGDSPIFSPAIHARARDAHFEMTALSIGIQLELNAMNHYRRLAEESSDPEWQRFFRELADWEKGHYEGLLRQQEDLKNDYWSDSGFSPF